MSYGRIRSDQLTTFARRVANISSTSLEGHLAQMLDVEGDGEGLFLVCERPFCHECITRNQNTVYMTQILSVLIQGPLTVWGLREEIARLGNSIEDDSLLEMLRQLLARGRLVEVVGTRQLTLPASTLLPAAVEPELVSTEEVPPEPKVRSRFDIIDD